MAKDRTSDATRPKTGGAGASRSGKGGRTRPPVNVVAPQRPWGLIAAAVAVVVFAVAVIGYAVVKVNAANANKVESIDEIEGITTAEYEAGQHVGTTVEYAESPPIGGEHDPVWADCTGTVYDVDIRHENAVHSLEHGAVWITYNPDEVSEADIATLTELVDGESGRMLSPYVGPRLPRQPPVVEPPAEGRLGRRPAGRAVRRLPDPQPRLPPRGRRQLREPGVRRRPAARRRGRDAGAG